MRSYGKRALAHVELNFNAFEMDIHLVGVLLCYVCHGKDLLTMPYVLLPNM